MDLATGFVFTKESDRQLAWRRVKEEAPFVLIGSPPCTYFSMLQELNIATNKHKLGWMQNFETEREKAKQHVNFCCSLYRYQIDQGRRFVHEHPWSARSWALPSIQQLLNHPSVQLTQTHMCRFLMETHIDHKGGEMGLVKKPTGFMSSSRYIIQELDRKCTGDHDHVPLVGGRAAGAAIYPQALCEAICRGTAKQKKMGQKDNLIVNTGKMSTEQVKSFTNELCSIQL